MIAANELRIGNWVEYDEFGICRIESINRDSALLAHGLFDTLIPNDLINPIAITPEILESNGFIQVKNDILPYWQIVCNGEDAVIEWHDDNSILVGRKNECDKAFNSNYPIQYIHQLQNLYFALTGEELHIKL